MVIAFLAAAPLGVLFLLSRGVLAFVLLGLFGAILISTFSIAVVLGQAYLPTHAATASGLIVGFAIGMGGVGAALLGWVADHIGLTTTLWITALLPLAGFGTSLFLPDPRERRE
jgi:MFS transporter, FSR family, fosmidomycin resistance protein